MSTPDIRYGLRKAFTNIGYYMNRNFIRPFAESVRVNLGIQEQREKSGERYKRAGKTKAR